MADDIIETGEAMDDEVLTPEITGAFAAGERENCEICADMSEYAYDFIINGVTDKVCGSLKSDTGLNPDLDVLHKNCEDLHDAIDCLLGSLHDGLEYVDICDIKDFLDKLLRNLINILEAIHCADCGQWEEIWKIWDEIFKIWAEIEKLWKEFEKVWAEIWKLWSETEKLWKEIFRINNEIELIKENIIRIENIISEMQNEINNIHNEIDGIHNDITNILNVIDGILGDIIDIKGDIIDIKGDITDIWNEISDIKGDINNIYKWLNALAGTYTWLTKGVDYDITFYNGFYTDSRDIHIGVSEVGNGVALVRMEGAANGNWFLQNDRLIDVKIRHSAPVTAVPESRIYGVTFMGQYSYLNGYNIRADHTTPTGVWNIISATTGEMVRASFPAVMVPVDGVVSYPICMTFTSLGDGYNTQLSVYNDNTLFSHHLNHTVNFMLTR